MSDAARPRVLCVDDEPNVLQGLNRHLRRHFEVQIATRGRDALRRFERGETFAVVVSDLRMPELDGIELLTRVREISPDTTRVLLTGNADLSAAIAAVNEGNIFRFLSKPCPAEILIPAVRDAAEQHRLVTAERVLQEETLLGSVKMLTEVLGLAQPGAFGRASRIRDRAGAVAAHLGEPPRWKVEMAAMLSQVACITLPPDTLERTFRGDDLSPAEQAMVDRLPEIGETLLAKIPRLEDVRDMVRHHRAANGADVPLGARILRAVVDLEGLEGAGTPTASALELMQSAPGTYDEAVLRALAAVLSEEGPGQEVREVDVEGLRVGMVLLDDVETVDGRLLVAHGQEVSSGMLERLRNFAENMEIKEPVRVLCPAPA